MEPRSSLLPMLLAAVETAINGVLREDPASLRRCARLAGRLVRVEVEGLGLDFFVAVETDGLRLMDDSSEAPDAQISGAPLALLGLLGTRASDSLFTGAVALRGDAQTGQRVHRLLTAVEFDWEEQLSRVCGDLLARKAGNALRGLSAWGRRSRRSLALDLQEYLQEETGALVARGRAEDFLDAVDTLATDVDRLAVRIERLEKGR